MKIRAVIDSDFLQRITTTAADSIFTIGKTYHKSQFNCFQFLEVSFSMY